MSLSKHIIYLY